MKPKSRKVNADEGSKKCWRTKNDINDEAFNNFSDLSLSKINEDANKDDCIEFRDVDAHGTDATGKEKHPFALCI